MSVLTEGNNLADWLVEEFGAPNYCRAEKVVIVDKSLPAGMCLGAHTLTPALYPYDNSAPAAVTAILMNALIARDGIPVTSITDSSNTATVVTPGHHGLIVGDIVQVYGATVDTDLNCFATVATAADAHTFTFTSASVTDTAYTETTLRVRKANQPATCLVKGPATISSGGLSWAAACGSTEITAGLVDIAAFSPAVKILEGV